MPLLTKGSPLLLKRVKDSPGEIVLFLVQTCKTPHLVLRFEVIALTATFFLAKPGE
ncbi:MAG TPA: hypothetical protein VE860_02050 [Chthoniobacterales bacterium]|nr:hypothetical protein [Chthoniobacterales bacterium]